MADNIRVIRARIQPMKDTRAEWETVNPILLDGEKVVVIDGSYLRAKTGDGISTFTQLSFDDELAMLTPANTLALGSWVEADNTTALVDGLYFIRARIGSYGEGNPTATLQFMICIARESITVVKDDRGVVGGDISTPPAFYIGTTKYKFMSQTEGENKTTIQMYIDEAVIASAWAGWYMKLA